MQLQSLHQGQTIALHHPLAGPQPLDLHERLRRIKLTDAEAELVREVSAAINKLNSQAAAYGASKLRDELEAAKREIAENITEEALENIARLTSLAENAQIAKAVEREAHDAVRPSIEAQDARLIPIADRLIAEVRNDLERAAAKFSLQPLAAFVADSHLGQIAAYVEDRIEATKRFLDGWNEKARACGALAFLCDDLGFRC
jgi:hypothetical protein